MLNINTITAGKILYFYDPYDEKRNQMLFRYDTVNEEILRPIQLPRQLKADSKGDSSLVQVDDFIIVFKWVSL